MSYLPQILLTAYMIVFWFGRIFSLANNKNYTSKETIIGAVLGITFMPIAVILLAYWGGFYS